MPDPEPSLRPAIPKEPKFTLTQGRLRDGKKSFQSAREISATITAAHLLDRVRKQAKSS